jgi:ACT domain-containing protein
VREIMGLDLVLELLDIPCQLINVLSLLTGFGVNLVNRYP